ncbi:hypothetical protein Bca4012_012236 [Brassica carinata]
MLKWAKHMQFDHRPNNRTMNMNGARPLVQGGSRVSSPHSEGRGSDILDAWFEQLANAEHISVKLCN